MMLKHTKILSIVFLGCSLIASCSSDELTKFDEMPKADEIPKNVVLTLEPTNSREPSDANNISLRISVPGPIGVCVHSDLLYDLQRDEGHLTIDILGYKTDNRECVETVIPVVDSSILYNKTDKKITVLLNDETNEFEIIQEGLTISLTPKSTVNVNGQDEIISFPSEVRTLFIRFGPTEPNKNYTEDLAQFAVKNGYIDASLKYPELEPSSNTSIYVIPTNDLTKENKQDFIDLGELIENSDIQIRLS